MDQQITDRRASADQEAKWFFDRLFDGIELDAASEMRALQIIVATEDDRRRDRPPPVRQWDRWDEDMAAYDARDRELLRLLDGDDERRRFAANATASRAYFDELRARASKT